MPEHLPHTIIQLPPQHQRSLSGIGLMILLFVMAGITAVFLIRLAVTPISDSRNATVSDSLPSPRDETPQAGISTPITVNVEVILLTPEPTATMTPHVTSGNVTPILDYCSASTKSGSICIKPVPTPPPPTPALDCSSAQVGPGARCRWNPTPVVGGLFE